MLESTCLMVANTSLVYSSLVSLYTGISIINCSQYLDTYVGWGTHTLSHCVEMLLNKHYNNYYAI